MKRRTQTTAGFLLPMDARRQLFTIEELYPYGPVEHAPEQRLTKREAIRKIEAGLNAKNRSGHSVCVNAAGQVVLIRVSRRKVTELWKFGPLGLHY